LIIVYMCLGDEQPVGKFMAFSGFCVTLYIIYLLKLP
jgi:hypothetical protein